MKIFDALSFAVFAAFFFGAVAVVGFYLFVLWSAFIELVDMLPL